MDGLASGHKLSFYRICEIVWAAVFTMLLFLFVTEKNVGA